MRDAAGAVIGAVNMLAEITERKRAEEQQALLLRELTHRVKNSLAVAQAIAHTTLRTMATPDQFAARFLGRLQALATSHDVLMQSDWRGADLVSLIAGQVAGQVGDDGTRLQLDGPTLSLPPEVAADFGLVMHELATNAAKYGALSCPGGKVTIRWRVTKKARGRRLSLTWMERGGPPVTAPGRTGFGTAMIRRVFGDAALRFETAGVSCALTHDLPAGPTEVPATGLVCPAAA
jgi:two-component system CheB/CheR fusion protein